MHTIQYNAIKTLVSCTVIDCLVVSETRAVTGRAEVVIMEFYLS